MALDAKVMGFNNMIALTDMGLSHASTIQMASKHFRKAFTKVGLRWSSIDIKHTKLDLPKRHRNWSSADVDVQFGNRSFHSCTDY